MSGADALWADLRSCEQLIRDSAAHNDAREWDALAALYTSDGRLTRPTGQVAVGPDEIRAAYAAGAPDRRTRHLCTDIRIDLDPDGGRAHATTTVLLVSWTVDGTAGGSAASEGSPGDLPDAGGAVVGEFADRLVRTPEGWRIAERVARLDVRLR